MKYRPERLLGGFYLDLALFLRRGVDYGAQQPFFLIRLHFFWFGFSCKPTFSKFSSLLRKSDFSFIFIYFRYFFMDKEILELFFCNFIKIIFRLLSHIKLRINTDKHLFSTSRECPVFIACKSLKFSFFHTISHVIGGFFRQCCSLMN